MKGEEGEGGDAGENHGRDFDSPTSSPYGSSGTR